MGCLAALEAAQKVLAAQAELRRPAKRFGLTLGPACVCRLQVTGCLKMRTYLSGMPECKLGLNDKVRTQV